MVQGLSKRTLNQKRMATMVQRRSSHQHYAGRVVAGIRRIARRILGLRQERALLALGLFLVLDITPSKILAESKKQ